MKRRPSLYILIFIAIGIPLGFFFTNILGLLIALNILAIFFVVFRCDSFRLLVFLLICTTSTCLITVLRKQYYQAIVASIPAVDCFFDGYIISLSEKINGEKTAIVSMKPINFLPQSARTKVFVTRLHLKDGAAAVHLEEGDVIRLYGKALPLRPAFYPFAFDEALFGIVHGIHKRMVINKGHFIERIGHENNLIMDFRRNILRYLKLHLTPHEQSVIRANLFGDTGLFFEEQRELYRQIGAEHLLAVSGLQVSLLVWCIFFLSIPIILLFLPKNLCHYSRPISAIGALAFIVIFVLLCSGQKSAVRAVLMAGLCLLPQINRKYIDQWDAVIMSALIILLIDVFALFDLSFLFSFSCIIGLLIAHQKSEAIVAKAKSLSLLLAHFLLALCLSIGAVLAVWPSTIFIFGTFAPYAVIANLFIIPIASVLQIPIILGTIAGYFTSLHFLVHCAAHCGLVLERSVEICSRYLGLVFVVPERLRYVVPCYCVGIFLLLIFLANKNWRVGSVLLGLILASTFAFFIKENNLEVTVFAVGQGDSTLFRTNKFTMLIDGGGSFGDFDPGKEILVPRLKAKGISNIDLMLVTHPDLDHIEGLFAVIEEIKIGEIWFHEGSKAHPLIKKLLTHAEKYGISYRMINELRTIPIPDGTIDVFALDFTTPSGDNNLSLITRMNYQGISFLWTGDIEREAEEKLLGKNTALRSTILKAPHHGSSSSSTQAFVEAVQPAEVIFTTGLNNRFGFPKKEIMKRYQDKGSRIWDTAKNGEITIVVKERTLHITSHIKSSKNDHFQKTNLVLS